MGPYAWVEECRTAWLEKQEQAIEGPPARFLAIHDKEQQREIEGPTARFLAIHDREQQRAIEDQKNEALEAQKARFAKDEEQFKKREESLRTKDLHLQHQLIRFNKSILVGH